MGALKIAAAIIAVIVVLAVIAIIFMALGHVRENNYCNNWAANIEKQRSELNIFSDTDAFNAQVNEYNQQCAY